MTATAGIVDRRTYLRQGGVRVPSLPGLDRRWPTTTVRLRLDRNYVEISRVLTRRLKTAALMAAHTGRNELVRELGEGGGATVGVR